MPTSTIQFSWPFLVRFASVAGSSAAGRHCAPERSGRFVEVDVLGRLDFRLRAVADEDRLAAPRTVIACPSLTGDRSISIDESASVLASGFICWMKGQSSEAAPTAAKALAATTKKSRRFGSKASVVTGASRWKPERWKASSVVQTRTRRRAAFAVSKYQ